MKGILTTLLLKAWRLTARNLPRADTAILDRIIGDCPRDAIDLFNHVSGEDCTKDATTRAAETARIALWTPRSLIELHVFALLYGHKTSSGSDDSAPRVPNFDG